MDEYITRNNVISAVCFGCNQEFSDEPCEPDACAIRQSIKAIPTDDVVPKSEAEEYKHNWQKIHDSYTADCLEHYNKGRSEVAMEIFSEIEELAKIYTLPVIQKGIVEIEKEAFWCIEPSDLAELKKKYTEGKTDAEIH